MKKIGITGCIGSGKSTVSRIFSILNVPVYDADSRAKRLMETHEPLIQRIKLLLSEQAYLPDGTLNRAYIARIVFQRESVLEQLNALVHPAVFADFDDWCSQQDAPYVIKEAALMFESDSYKQLDAVITVTAPEALRIERTIQRDSISREAVLARMANQMQEDEKRKRSQYEIRNNEQELIIPQVLQLHKKFLA